MTLSLVLRFLHILSAAVWFGSALFWPGGLRRALATGLGPANGALQQARAGLGLDLGAGLATVITGLLYASPLGGVQMRAGIVAGLGFAFARLALLFVLARPALRLTGDAATAGNLEAARAASKRVAAYAGSAHLLWIVALASMVFPY